jgi:hypothetical protein
MRDAALKALIADRARIAPSEPAVGEAHKHAEALRARHGAAVAAVLMYGSTLRDGQIEGRILDFYVLVDRVGPAYRSALPRLLAAIDQPNVHYLPAGAGRAAPAKYALMTLRAFARRAGPGGFSSYIWGRFAQPCWIAWARDPQAEAAVIDALAEAARSMLRSAAPMLPTGASSEQIWTRAFGESYRAEPRAEPAGKAAEIYRANAAYYDALASAVLPGLETPSPRAAQQAWARRRVFGKALAAARIFKSALTFEGGLDYAIWKISRHSDAGIDADPQASTLAKLRTLWRLVRTRAIR